MSDTVSDQPEPVRIGLDAAREQLSSGDALLLDVRDDDAWLEGHAPGAIHVPLDQLADRLGQLPTERPIITTCGGGTRGVRAARLLEQAGRDVAVLKGGMRGWRAAGLPLDQTSSEHA